MDAIEITDALIRMMQLWGPWGYEVEYSDGIWHAKYLRTEPPEQWHAPSDQQLHLALFRHYSAGLRLPPLEPLN